MESIFRATVTNAKDVILPRTTLAITSTNFGVQAIGVVVTQAVSGAAGTLSIALTGATVTVVVTPTNDIMFDTTNAITVNSHGSTPVPSGAAKSVAAPICGLAGQEPHITIIIYGPQDGALPKLEVLYRHYPGVPMGQQALTLGGNNLAGVASVTVLKKADSSTLTALQIGAAYIFRGRNSGATWAEEQKITASDSEAGDMFGWSVAVHGTVAVVGSPEETTLGHAAGAVYVYTYSVPLTIASTNFGSQAVGVAVTQANSGAGGTLGTALTGATTTVVVIPTNGAVFDLVNVITVNGHGSTPVPTVVGGVWTQMQKLHARDSLCGLNCPLTTKFPNRRFGYSVALNGDTMVIGELEKSDGVKAHATRTRHGAAYVSDCDDDSRCSVVCCSLDVLIVSHMKTLLPLVYHWASVKYSNLICLLLPPRIPLPRSSSRRRSRT